MATIKFWSEMTKATSVDGQDKVMIGKNSNGEAMYVDFQYLVNQAGAQASDYIPIDGNTLPTLGTENKFSIVGSGTYTQAVGGDVVVPENSLGIIVWDGDEWSLGQGVELPESITKIAPSQVDSVLDSGLYAVSSTITGNTYLLEVSVVGGVVRQYRIRPNHGQDPYISYRDYDSSEPSPSWSSWTAQRLLKEGNGSYNDLTEAGIYYRDLSTTRPMLLWVNTSENDDTVGQMRIYPTENPSNAVIEGRTRVAGVWTAWTAILGTGLMFDSSGNNLYNFKTPGLHKYTKGAAVSMPIQVSISGNVLRQWRIISNVGTPQNPPQLMYRDFDLETETWDASWRDAYDITGFTGFTGSLHSSALNTQFTAGVYYVTGTNPYTINVVEVNNVVRQFRVAPNMTGEPRIEYRDYDTAVEIPSWTEWKTPTSGVTPSTPLKMDSVSDDMMWSWWAYPLIQRTGWQDKLYISYTDGQGETGVYQRSMKDGSSSKMPVKQTILDVDDHNAGGVIRLDDGRLLTAFPAGHNASKMFYVYRSTRRESNTEWESVFSDDVGEVVSYSQILYLSGSIHIFYRHRSPQPNAVWSWSVISSSDNGDTWLPPRLVIQHASLQWYGIFRPCTDEINTVKFVHYSNPTLPEAELRLGYINMTSGAIFNADGTTQLGTLGTGSDVMDFTVIVPKVGSESIRLLDLKISPKSDVKILYNTFTSPTNGVYKLYENGVSTDIVASGASFYNPSRYVGGAVFGENDDVYTMRRDSGESILERYVNGALDEEISRSERLGIRPIYHDRVLAWLEGHYNINDYKDFCMQLVTREV